jgi:hypothetical protein
MVESVYRQLNDAGRAQVACAQWHLPSVLLDLQAAPKEDWAVSSAEMAFGVPLCLPDQLATEAEVPCREVAFRLERLQPPHKVPLT